MAKEKCNMHILDFHIVQPSWLIRKFNGNMYNFSVSVKKVINNKTGN